MPFTARGSICGDRGLLSTCLLKSSEDSPIEDIFNGWQKLSSLSTGSVIARDIGERTRATRENVTGPVLRGGCGDQALRPTCGPGGVGMVVS